MNESTFLFLIIIVSISLLPPVILFNFHTGRLDENNQNLQFTFRQILILFLGISLEMAAIRWATESGAHQGGPLLVLTALPTLVSFFVFRLDGPRAGK